MDFGRVWVIVNPCVGGDDSVGLTAVCVVLSC